MQTHLAHRRSYRCWCLPCRCLLGLSPLLMHHQRFGARRLVQHCRLVWPRRQTQLRRLMHAQSPVVAATWPSASARRTPEGGSRCLFCVCVMGSTPHSAASRQLAAFSTRSRMHPQHILTTEGSLTASAVLNSQGRRQKGQRCSSCVARHLLMHCRWKACPHIPHTTGASSPGTCETRRHRNSQHIVLLAFTSAFADLLWRGCR